jgi:hypothetical protein
MGRPVAFGFIAGVSGYEADSWIRSSAPSGVQVDASELGYSFSLFGAEWVWDWSNRFSVRVGAEYHFPEETLMARQNGDSFQIESSVESLVSYLGVEWALWASKSSRINLGLSGGYADTSMTHRVGAVTGRAAFDEKSSDKSSQLPFQAYLASEFPLINNFTFALNIGYRFHKSDGFTYDSATNAWDSANPRNKGDKLADASGNPREVDLSGIYALGSLRVRF